MLGDSNGVIPFNLNKVVSILVKSRQPIDKFLDTIKQHPEKWMRIEFYDEFMKNAVVANNLRFIPYFDPDSIDLSLLGEIIGQEEDDSWDEALDELEKNFLVKINAEDKLSVHRLMQKEL